MILNYECETCALTIDLDLSKSPRGVLDLTFSVETQQIFKFLAHLAKGNVSFCHHLASVVCRMLSVKFSHFNLFL